MSIEKNIQTVKDFFAAIGRRQAENTVSSNLLSCTDIGCGQ